MIAFVVNDMSCAHCVATITKAVQAADGSAKLRVDLPSHRVEIDVDPARAAQFAQAIEDAGYTPTPAASPR